MSRRVTTVDPRQILERYHGGPDTGVFTDGSCTGNPGPGGWAAVWVIAGEIIKTDTGASKHTTNNRMELEALIAGLKMLPLESNHTLYSDSNLCVQTANNWAKNWKKRGWKRKGGEIANLELVKELYDLYEARPSVKITWIRAHDGSRWNEYVDALAFEAGSGF